jgi:hypothetical protein
MHRQREPMPTRRATAEVDGPPYQRPIEAGFPLRSNAKAWTALPSATPSIRTSGPGGIISLPLQFLSLTEYGAVSSSQCPLDARLLMWTARRINGPLQHVARYAVTARPGQRRPVPHQAAARPALAGSPRCPSNSVTDGIWHCQLAMPARRATAVMVPST